MCTFSSFPASFQCVLFSIRNRTQREKRVNGSLKSTWIRIWYSLSLSHCRLVLLYHKLQNKHTHQRTARRRKKQQCCAMFLIKIKAFGSTVLCEMSVLSIAQCAMHTLNMFISYPFCCFFLLLLFALQQSSTKNNCVSILYVCVCGFCTCSDWIH